MSAVHFAVACDDKGCMLRDLDSTNGTWVNGARVTTALLANGDTVAAGETTFSVQIIAEQAEAAAPVAAAPTPQEKLLAMLRGEFQLLYAVLDAAREPEVLKVLVESKEDCRSLYEGAQGAQLAHFAPYLVRLPKESPLLETLVEKGWGNSWGVYLTCASELQEVRQHLRRFLEAQLPEGKQVYFRFYDPRVLRVFLPTCTADEIKQFFGPIRQYLMEDEKPDKLLQFARTDKGAEAKVVDLSPPAGREDKRPASSPGAPTLTWMDKLTPDQGQ
jgi:Domain of unknown function (DUF4123)/FHA domain